MSMLYQRYKKTRIFIHIDDDGTFYAFNLENRTYSEHYGKLDDLRDDLRLNQVKWMTLQEYCRKKIMEEYCKTA